MKDRTFDAFSDTKCQLLLSIFFTRLTTVKDYLNMPNDSSALNVFAISA